MYPMLAKMALETYVRDGQWLAAPEDLPPELTQRQAGVFVSLKKDGRLRGCIGTIRPATDCIADEIIYCAVQAGTRDPRFSAVTVDELPQLVYSVDILGPAEPITDIAQLDPSQYGVIVTEGYRRGLLLPNLEGIDTAEQQVAIALQKAGIRPVEPYSMERFKVTRYA